MTKPIFPHHLAASRVHVVAGQALSTRLRLLVPRNAGGGCPDKPSRYQTAMNPDSFKFWCPSCGQHIAVTRSAAGTHANCPACGSPLIVPAPPNEGTALSGASFDPGAHGLRIPPPRPPASRKLALGLAMVTATVLVIVAISAYLKSGGKIGRTPFQPLNPSCVLHVAVMDSGKLFADGKEVDLDGLRGMLAKTKRDNGLVKFYRQSPSGGDGGKLAREAMAMIDDLVLPVVRANDRDNLDPFLKGPPERAP